MRRRLILIPATAYFVFWISLCNASEQQINIAAIFAQTGNEALNDVPSIEGVQIAVKEINEKGGILDRRMMMAVFDNQSTAIGSKIAAENAVKTDILAIIGSSWSSHSLVIAKVAQRSGVPMISNISTHPDVTKTGDCIFRVCYTNSSQAQALARFCREDLNAKTAVMLVNVSSDFSMDLARSFQDFFESHKGKVLMELNYIYKERDFSTILNKAKTAGPDILFIPGHDESGKIANQAQNMGISAIPVGGDGWGADTFYSKGGRYIRKGYFCSHWVPGSNEKVDHFVRKYNNIYKIEDGTVLSYDAVSILADAMRRAGRANREAVRKELAETNNFPGLTGNISFDENGDPIKDVVIIAIEYGKERFFKAVRPDR